MVDVARLKESWHVVASCGDDVPLHFYSTLFLMFPETRQLFPVGMAAQRDRLVGALGHVVSNVDRVNELVPFLEQLGRDHRKFAVVAEHYPQVGAALLATLEYFLGDRWTDELAADWRAAYELIAKVMTDAAQQAASTSPPWWEAEVLSHDRRALDVAVLQVRPNYRLDYRPGQSLAVETPRRPRLWRYYSPANAPRPDGSLELHVKLVPGGAVSTVLVQATQLGDVLWLGSPVGHGLTLDPQDGRPMLLLAGGTGWAPFKALVEQLVVEGSQRRVQLFLGARTERDLYDLNAATKMADQHPWLTVVPVISNDPLHPQEQALVVDAALGFGAWPEHVIYVCGSDAMVSGTLTRLAEAGVPPERIRVEDFARTQHQATGVVA